MLSGRFRKSAFFSKPVFSSQHGITATRQSLSENSSRLLIRGIFEPILVGRKELLLRTVRRFATRGSTIFAATWRKKVEKGHFSPLFVEKNKLFHQTTNYLHFLITFAFFVRIVRNDVMKSSIVSYNRYLTS